MVLHEGFATALQAIAALRHGFPGAVELILVDVASDDEIRFIGRYVHGARIVRFDVDIAPLAARNVGLLHATSEAVLLLDKEVKLAPETIAAGLARLAAEPDAGAVGGKLIRPQGMLREAGRIVWADGTSLAYMRDAAPLAPEANFVRDVDACASALLFLRHSALAAIGGGFDEDTVARDLADADLCLRLSAAGWRVVYDPLVQGEQLEPPPAALEPDALVRGRAWFAGKHRDALARRHAPDRTAALEARCAGERKLRVLFVEDHVPLRRIGSGFVRSNDIVRTMAGIGYQVTVFPMMDDEFDPAAVFADMPDTAEVFYDRTLTDLTNFLMFRRGYYDAIWVARTHNLERVRDPVERAFRGQDRRPRMILDTEAIATRRALLQAGQSGEALPEADAMLRREFANAVMCDQVVAVNRAEAETLSGLGLPRVSVLGHMRTAEPTPRPFAERQGMLFLGAMHQPDSPNYDGLCWFVDEVLPLVEQSLRWETRLVVAGYASDKVPLDRFRDHPRITLAGAVADLRPLYNAARIFVAPTRFAAGMPYKIHESASFGLPVVATEILRQQLGWDDGRELLAADADPVRFAALVSGLYRDPALWQHLRDAALLRIGRENTPADYAAAIRGIMEPVAPSAFS
jgi:glycosyltransferase involved in cell wall biosynthesis